jgi:hypothetical protein
MDEFKVVFGFVFDNFIWLVPVLWCFIASIQVYNRAYKLRTQLSERLSAIQTSRAKLDQVFAEVLQLLGKYSIHESALLSSVAKGQANITFLASQFPQLKADQLYQQATQESDTLYDELQHQITQYNSLITDYETYIKSVPRVIITIPLGFKSSPHLDLDAVIRNPTLAQEYHDRRRQEAVSSIGR